MPNFTLGCTGWYGECVGGRFEPSEFSLGINYIALLVLPAATALNATVVCKPMEKPTGYANLSDPGSLPSLLLSEEFDIADINVVINYERWPVLRFAYPYNVIDMVIVTAAPKLEGKPVSFTFLSQPFHRSVWIATLVLTLILALLAFGILSNCGRLGAGVQLFFVLESFVGLMSQFYAAKLTAISTGPALQFHRPSFEYLAQKLASREYVMVTPFANHYVFEFLNHSKIDEVRKFREALFAANPPIVGENFCEYFRNLPNPTTKYFFIGSNFEVTYFCGNLLLARNVNLQITSVAQAPISMTSLAFSADAEMLRRKVSTLSIHGFFMTENVRLQRKLRRYNVVFDDDEGSGVATDEDGDTVFGLAEFLSGLSLLTVGLGAAIFAFWLEMLAALSHSLL